MACVREMRKFVTGLFAANIDYKEVIEPINADLYILNNVTESGLLPDIELRAEKPLMNELTWIEGRCTF